jgi:DNA-binding MarR family transcriptional regulator
MARGRRYEHLLTSIGVLRHPCDLDLLLFFHRHPQALLTGDRLAAYVGYDLNQTARSLDLLTEAGFLRRSQNPTHAARMYVLQTPAAGWLASLIDIASTPEGRRSLLDAMKEASEADASDSESTQSDVLRRARRTNVS